ncbi:MAG: TerD family protein [Jatrophihabitantaceae bacterium]
MPIDYTKRPAPAVPPAAPATPSGPVVLTKAAPTVSLAKTGGGTLRVNLNWNARATEPRGLFKKAAPSLDLDLGCLYEFTDGSKGVVQALGNAFVATDRDTRTPIIRLDGDDRSGAVSGGENLLVDLAHVARIRRVLVFALIYEGAANWAAADGVATLYPAAGPSVTIRLDDPRDGARICAIAMLESQGGTLHVRREVNYINGGQRALDEAYGWGMRWTAGRK